MHSFWCNFMLLKWISELFCLIIGAALFKFECILKEWNHDNFYKYACAYFISNLNIGAFFTIIR